MCSLFRVGPTSNVAPLRRGSPRSDDPFEAGSTNVYSRNGPRDDQSLDLTRALEDRVGIRVAHKSPHQGLFVNWRDPRITEIDPCAGGSGRICTWLVGRERAPQFSTAMIPVMRNTANDNPTGPPQTAYGRRTISPCSSSSGLSVSSSSATLTSLHHSPFGYAADAGAHVMSLPGLTA